VSVTIKSRPVAADRNQWNGASTEQVARPAEVSTGAGEAGHEPVSRSAELSEPFTPPDETLDEETLLAEPTAAVPGGIEDDRRQLVDKIDEQLRLPALLGGADSVTTFSDSAVRR